MPTYLINDMTTWTIEADSEEEALDLYIENGEDLADFEDQGILVVGEV